MKSLQCLLGLLVSTLIVSGCTTTQVNNLDDRIVAERAQQEIPTAQLLNVNIAEFNPNIPPLEERDDDLPVVPAVREAEASYFAYNLRTTLESTGYWGAVRVVPEIAESTELGIEGTILKSDGETLKLKIRAVDATGRVWIDDKTYSHRVGSAHYNSRTAPEEPFQSLYNEIANDLLAERRRLAEEDLKTVRQVAEMRFAAQIVPEAFDHYLEKDNGRYHLTGLPAEGDPMMERVSAIKKRDNLLVDSLDQYYQNFHHNMDPAYDQWRSTSYEEMAALRKLKREANTRKFLGGLGALAGVVALANSESSAQSAASQAVIFGGVQTIRAGISKSKDSEIHEVTLRELNTTLGGDLEPKVMELEGKTVTLQGSAKEQYREWQQVLGNMHQIEIGAAPD